MSTLKKLEAQLALQEKILTNIKENIKLTLDNPPDEAQEIAIVLHGMQCNWNHTDGCGWFWEIKGGDVHEWTGYTHKEFLKKAQKFISECKRCEISTETAFKAWRLVEGKEV